jgi:hypothetical protein
MQSRLQSLCCEISQDAVTAVYTYLKIELRYNSRYKELKRKTVYIIDNNAPKKENQKSKV